MTVGELIERLKAYPASMEVRYGSPDGGDANVLGDDDVGIETEFWRDWDCRDRRYLETGQKIEYVVVGGPGDA